MDWPSVGIPDPDRFLVGAGSGYQRLSGEKAMFQSQRHGLQFVPKKPGRDIP